MFLIPSISGIAEISSSDGTIPVCAVYSSVPVKSMKFKVVINNNPIDLPAMHVIHEGFGLNFVTLSGDTARQISSYFKLCIVETKWETIETAEYNIVINGNYKYCKSILF